VTRKPTYEELEQKIRALEEVAVNGKRTEDALRQSEEAFQSLFDDHTAVKLIVDPDTGVIVKANHAAATFYGWSRETLAQMNIQQINTLPPDKIKESMKDARDQMRTHFEFQHRMADGSVRDVEVFSSGMMMDGHEYLHSIVHDITERSHAEREKTIISEIGRIIGSSLNIDEVYERFSGEVRKLISFDRIGLSVNDPESGTVTITYMSGMPIEGRNVGTTFPLAGSFHEELIRTRTAFIMDPTSLEALAKRSPAAQNSYKAGIRSMLNVPLISQGEVIGSLNFRSKTPHAFTERDLSLASRIGDQIAGAIANAKIHANLKRAEQEMAVIAEIGRIIGSSLNIDEVYERFTTDWL
jgi:PAS domain S-box-containing protein